MQPSHELARRSALRKKNEEASKAGYSGTERSQRESRGRAIRLATEIDGTRGRTDWQRFRFQNKGKESLDWQGLKNLYKRDQEFRNCADARTPEEEAHQESRSGAFILLARPRPAHFWAARAAFYRKPVQELFVLRNVVSIFSNDDSLILRQSLDELFHWLKLLHKIALRVR